MKLSVLFLSLLPINGLLFGMEKSLSVGETLTYDVGWKSATAGSVILKLEEKKLRQSRPAIKATAQVASNAFIDAVFRVRDRMESWIDEKTGTSSGFSIRLEEGDKRRQQDVFLNPVTGTYKSRLSRPQKNPPVIVSGGRIVKGSHDFLSSLYCFRQTQLKVGQMVPLNVFDGKEEISIALKLLREEQVTVPSGTFDCLMGEILIKTASTYNPPPQGQILIWLTNDAKRIPVQFVADPAFGRLEVKLANITN